jgi:hypothetical protein
VLGKQLEQRRLSTAPGIRPIGRIVLTTMEGCRGAREKHRDGGSAGASSGRPGDGHQDRLDFERHARRPAERARRKAEDAKLEAEDARRQLQRELEAVRRNAP